MHIEEYEKVKDYGYEEYISYLNDKYGRVPRKYGSRINRRPDEGLFIHHIREDVVASLSNSKVRKISDPSYQEPYNLVYCNYLEHFLLHIKIGFNTACNKNLGLYGLFVYIIPALKNYYNRGWKNPKYNPAYFDVVKEDREVFDILLERYNKLVEDIDIVLEENQTLYAEMEKCLDEKGKALLVLGTGLGKTTTALQYICKHQCKALVISPNKLIEDGWERYGEIVDVTTYSSFANNYKKIDFSKYGLVVLDEAHHAGYDEENGTGACIWSKGIRFLLENGVKVLGLTATPVRSDGIDVGSSMFDGCVCEGRNTEDAIEDGIIHPFSYVTAIYDTDSIKKEYENCEDKLLVKQLDLAINNTPTVRQILRDYTEKLGGVRKGIVFIQEIEDKQYVLDIMKDIFPDMEFRSIDSKMDSTKVRENREWFENTKSGYLIAVNMISEGAHYSGVNTLIMFRRTNSYLVYTQQIGRIITLTKDEDPHAIVFDLVNNCENVQYNDRKIDNDKRVHSISRIIEAVKKAAEKSEQIIVADETRDIVECIRKIKEYNSVSWTEEELNVLIHNYPIMGLGCAKLLHKRTKGMVRSMASKLRLRRNNRTITDEDIAIIEKYYPIEGIGCVKRCQREFSYALIYKIARERGLHSPIRGLTNEEKAVVEEYYPTEGRGVLQRLPKGVTLSQVASYASKNGISYSRRYSDIEKSIINTYYPSEGPDGCLRRLKNRSRSNIIAEAKKLSVKFHSRYKRVRCVEKGIIFDRLSDAAAFAMVTNGAISMSLTGKCKTAGGYHWEYVEEEE